MSIQEFMFPLSALEGAILGALTDTRTEEYKTDLTEPVVNAVFSQAAQKLPTGATDETLDELRRYILRVVMATIPESGPPVIKDHKPWLRDLKSEIAWPRWRAYRKMLAKKGISGLVLEKLDRFTDEILDVVGNPRANGPWNRRGLLIGDVQSGKTQNYVALMNKAADAGYRLIIVLSGNTEYLRRQTQERVDEGFIGRDTAGASAPKTSSVARTQYIGVGKIDRNVANVTSLTTVLMDFLQVTKKGISVAMPTDSSAPLVFVLKKNRYVLEAVEAWAKDQSENGKIDLPLLLLDDESDYASINTNDADDPTAINTAIRRILSRFIKSSYVAITATPFANIFIDDDASHALEEDGVEVPDLFPEDYIFPLEAPTNYVGINATFGEHYTDDLPGLCPLEDAESWIPIKHKKNHPVGELPESLGEAIRTFLLVNALMDLRIKMPKRRSMLINVSRFTAVQDKIAERTSDELYRLKDAIELHGVSFANGRRNSVLEELKDTFDKHFSSTDVSWPAILATLHHSVADIQVKVYNSSPNKQGEDDDFTDDVPSRQIAVGGDLLSRGLTLEGLVVSYFHRSVGAADTMMQMARWFGYRDGFRDLCRLWISEKTASDYRFVQAAITELRDDLSQMQRNKMIPRDFGLAVQQHPESLLITARNKSKSAVADVKEVNLLGRNLETRKLSALQEVNDTNSKAIHCLARKAMASGIRPSTTQRKYWQLQGVPSALVADLLNEYRAAPDDIFFAGNSLAGKGLAGMVRSGRDIYSEWDVTFVNGRSGPKATGVSIESLLDGHTVYPVGRYLLPRKYEPTTSHTSGSPTSDEFTLWVSGNKTRVAGSDDLSKLLSEKLEQEAREVFADYHGSDEAVPESWFYRFLPRPQLLIYPLVPTDKVEEVDGKNETLPVPEQIIPLFDVAKAGAPIYALKVALPKLPKPKRRADTDPDDPTPLKSSAGVVKYLLNTVAQKHWASGYEELAPEYEAVR